MLWFGFDGLIDRFSQSSLGDSRKEFRQTMYGMPGASWLLGIQPGTFSDIYSYYAPSDVNFRLNHAHNDYLEFALEIGFIGLLLFLISLLPLFKRMVAAKSLKVKSYGVAALLIMIVHSLVDFSMHLPANAIYFFVLIGLWLNTSTDEKGSNLTVQRASTLIDVDTKPLTATKLTAKPKV